MALSNDILFTGRLGRDPELVTPQGETKAGEPLKPFMAFDIAQGPNGPMSKWIGVRCYGKMQDGVVKMGLRKGDLVRVHGALSHISRPCKGCKIPTRYYFILAHRISLVMEKASRDREEKKFRDAAPASQGRKGRAAKAKPF